MDDASPVTFVERDGPAARAALLGLRDRARRAGVPARLLASRDQPGLHLLVIEGELALDASERHGARVWRFRSTEPGRDSPGDGSPPEAPRDPAREPR